VARGRLAPPPSKSLTHRYLVLALLAGRPLTLLDPLDAEDTRLLLAALEALGWRVDRRPGAAERPDRAEAGGAQPAGTAGTAEVTLLPPAAGTAPAAVAIDCGNAGTMLRLLIGALATRPGVWRLDGAPRLRERPVGPLVEALRGLGAEIAWDGRPGYPPLTVRGGRLAGGRTRLDAGESSQYLSALLIAAQAAAAPVEIEVEALASAPYVEVTLAALARFGGGAERPAPGRFRVTPAALAGPESLRVEGDFSAACYPAAAAALTGGRVTLDRLARDSPQGDRGFFDLLAAMGARVAWSAGAVTVEGTGALAAVDADLGSMPDQVPTLAALAPFARGTTRIRGVPHLRLKESDRLAAMAAELGRLGAAVEERADGLVIPGLWAGAAPPAGAVTVDPHGDHRIAMSLAITALRRPGVSIAHPEVVAKSYPGFWDDFDALLLSSSSP
jgi:3-phosphoshikimate 1-carboxyvinyltransferase